MVPFRFLPTKMLISIAHWCYPYHPLFTDKKSGLIYVKLPKGSSSTFLGMNIRLARHVGARVLTTNTSDTGQNSSLPLVCSHIKDHGRWNLLHRESANGRLWTFLRDSAS
mmetsp:Transcript_19915/g.29938  ORF Transcript_19915/g.29938 Transcript_19915/m.29938 type:complete len:110 (+) Transcript_19915:237-566(+)